jgi:hypothetical protein
LKQVSPLSRGAKLEPLSDPLQAGIRFLLLPLPAAPSPSLLLGLPPPEAVALHRVYLVSQGAHLMANQTMGLGTFSPPCAHREQAAVDDTRLQAHCLLATALRFPGKQELAGHSDGGSDERSLAFPIPFTSPSSRGLAQRVAYLHRQARLLRAKEVYPRLHPSQLLKTRRAGEVTQFHEWFRERNKTP